MLQSGFTSGDSIIHQLLYLYDTFCKPLYEKKDIRIVFCNQSEAVDRVCHKGLLHMLKCIGIEGPLLTGLLTIYMADFKESPWEEHFLTMETLKQGMYDKVPYIRSIAFHHSHQ